MPNWVLNEIDKIRSGFLWHGVQMETRKIHLANWTIVCTPKKLGGLGVISLKTINEALLSKWHWQWCKADKKTWKGIFKALYTSNGLHESFFFKNHLKEITGFNECFTMRIVGRGDNVNFWRHDWGQGFMRQKFQTLYTYAIDVEVTMVSMLHSDNLASMFRPILSDQARSQLQLLEEELESIRRDQQHNREDDAIWKGHNSGNFTVKSAYFVIMNGPRIKPLVHRLWKLNVPPRFKVFAWLLFLNKILTTENLNRRGFKLVSICYMCRMSQETSVHLFDECAFTSNIYEKIGNMLFPQDQGILANETNSIRRLVDKKTRKEVRELLLTTQFIIWRERCSRIFEEITKSENDILEEIRSQWQVARMNNEINFQRHDAD